MGVARLSLSCCVTLDRLFGLSGSVSSLESEDKKSSWRVAVRRNVQKVPSTMRGPEIGTYKIGASVTMLVILPFISIISFGFGSISLPALSPDYVSVGPGPGGGVGEQEEQGLGCRSSQRSRSRQSGQDLTRQQGAEGGGLVGRTALIKAWRPKRMQRECGQEPWGAWARLGSAEIYRLM